MDYAGLIAGLGNPEKKYDHTRHNVGFDFVELLVNTAKDKGAATEMNGKKFQSCLWKIQLSNLEGTWLAAMPLTYMNNSGHAIKPLLDWHNLEPDQLIVVQDELDLPPGALRFKFGGGLAGHNGLASITACLGTRDYYRLRIGVGKPSRKDETINWVLGRPDPMARDKIRAAMPYALDTFLIFSREGLNPAESFAHATFKKIENADLQ